MVATNRLLIVDDEPAIARLIEVSALEAGFTVKAISDSGDFERALKEFEPTVVFLDISMPGRDGMELIGQLAAMNYPGKIVVASGAGASYVQISSAVAKSRGLQFAGTLAKPFRRQALMELLDKLQA
jgi:DNA-binding NtrC family response regulator